MLIDTHAHLDFPDFEKDLNEVVQRAVHNGVNTIITIGTTLESSRKAIQIAETFPQVYAVVGIHPNEAHLAPDDFYSDLKKLAQHPRVVGIGECGLDYHYLPSMTEKSPFKDIASAGIMSDPADLETQMADDEIKNKQSIVFQQQLDLAVEIGLNVIIHQRDSWSDTLKMLENYHGRVRTVFHCFGGTREDAELLLKNNHLVSFTGIVTFKNARQIQETVKALPPGSFMVETDCPYLAPTPFRGQRCEPFHARFTAEKIAELKNISPAEVAEMTSTAARFFFKLS